MATSEHRFNLHSGENFFQTIIMRKSFYFFLFFGTLFWPYKIFAQQLTPVDAGSSIEFSINNFGFSTKGSFKGLSGKISFDANDLTRSVFDVSILASSIETGNNTRDRHLRREDYFDVDHFNIITIKSESISTGKQSGSYILHGLLSIKGTSRNIEIPFTVKQTGSGYIFEGTLGLNRLDYKLGSNSLSLADNATVVLKILAR
jgi:polyisoprenoid-binding protein YceI